MATVTSSPLFSVFVPRRRFPWNIILLSIFVSGLGLVGGPGVPPWHPSSPGGLGGMGGRVGRLGAARNCPQQ